VVVFVVALIVSNLRGGSGSGASSSVQQLGAEMYVTSQNYQRDTADGDAIRATSDRETLLGDCNTARTIGLGQDAQSTAIRTLCQGLNDPVP